MTAQGIMSAPALLVRMTDLCNIAITVTSYRTQEINNEPNTTASTISEFWKEGKHISYKAVLGILYAVMRTRYAGDDGDYDDDDVVVMYQIFSTRWLDLKQLWRRNQTTEQPNQRLTNEPTTQESNK